MCWLLGQNVGCADNYMPPPSLNPWYAPENMLVTWSEDDPTPCILPSACPAGSPQQPMVQIQLMTGKEYMVDCMPYVIIFVHVNFVAADAFLSYLSLSSKFVLTAFLSRCMQYWLRNH